jgi:RNA polymerase sigma-70 factor (ECF subfamily)
VDLGETASLFLPARNGDPRARNALLERMRPRVVLWCALRMSEALKAKVEAEDVAQEVLAGANRALDRFEGDARAFQGLLFQIALNRIRDLADYHGSQKRTPKEMEAATRTSPSTAFSRGETFTRVRRALERLPEDYRTVIVLRRLEEQEVAEVARLMDRSENAVRILYFRAIQALKDALLHDGASGTG